MYGLIMVGGWIWKKMPKTRKSSRHKKTLLSKNESDEQKHEIAQTTTAELPAFSVKAKSLVERFGELIEKYISDNRDEHETYAKRMEKYFRNKFKFYGLRASQRRSIQLQWMSEEKITKETLDRGR